MSFKITFKSKRIYIAIFFLIFFCEGGYVAYARMDELSSSISPETIKAAQEEQRRAIEEAEVHGKLLKTPVCQELLLVTIADLKFSLPRTGLAIVDSNGKRLEYLDHKCEIKQLDSIRNFYYPNTGVADLRYNDYQSQYQQDKLLIEDARKGGNSKLVSHGMELITKGHLYIYILPSIANDIEDKDPISFSCTASGKNLEDYSLSDFCQTNYLYKKNLWLGYRFSRKDYPAEGHLKADRETRKRFETWMIKGD